MAGYQDALREWKINKVIVEDIKTPEGDGIYKQVKQLILRERPEAIFAFNDRTAVQTLWVANELSIKVPEELAVVGYDNLSEPYSPSVALTSIEQNSWRVARLASKLLLRRLQGDWSDFPQKIMVKPTLVIRQSCGCKAGKK